jgi:hypothetical protein
MRRGSKKLVRRMGRRGLMLALAVVAFSKVAFATPATVPTCTNYQAVTTASTDLEAAANASGAGRHFVQLCNSGPTLLWFCIAPAAGASCTAVSGQGMPVAPNTCNPPLTALLPGYPVGGSYAPQGDIEAIQDAASPSGASGAAVLCTF